MSQARGVARNETESAGLGPALAAFLSWAGAILSIALVIGLGIWGYKAVSRDVAGVPVLRAPEGPLRIRPETPGGELPVHYGLAVSAIAATGSAAPPPSRIVLAPRNVSFASEDLPMGELRIAVVETETAVKPPPTLRIRPATEDQPQAAALTLVPEGVAGIARSPLPRPRPERDLAAAAIAASVSRAVTADPVEIDPNSLEPGTHMVQLGAFDSTDVARSEWVRLQTRFPDFLGDRARVVQRSESGGKAFYRLRALGFDEAADARRLCAVLQEGGANCIPVVTR